MHFLEAWFLKIQRYISVSYTHLGIPLFGSNIGGKVCGYGIYTQANDGYVTELGIVRTLLEYGPIVFGLFCAFMLIAVWVLYKKGYFGAMVLLEIGFIACGVEAYFPACLLYTSCSSYRKFH